MQESHSQRRIELRPKVQRISLAVGFFCFVAAAASLFSFPFPFVRQMWIREVLGISGLLHVLVFLIILRQIEKHYSIPALLAGIGLVVNEQILSFRGFWILIVRQSVSSATLTYFIISTLASFVLALVLISVVRNFYTFRKVMDQKKPPVQLNPMESLRLLMPAVLIYGIIFGAVFYSVKPLEGATQFAVLKNIAWIASALSMTGIGLETNDYIDGIQTKKMCIIKSLSHAVCLIAILWAVYRLMPIESVLILN